MVQESRGENLRKGGLWDPSLDAPSFLEKTLLPTAVKEELDSLEEDQLMGQTVRQALATNCLGLSKLRRWKDSTKEGALKVAELTQRVGKLQMMHQETKVLLTEKSKEALELSAKNVKLHAEVDRLREE